MNYVLIKLFRTSQVVLVAKNPPANPGDIKRRGFDAWVGKIPWRRAWQPTPAFSPGESHAQRSLVGATAHGVTKSGAGHLAHTHSGLRA